MGIIGQAMPFATVIAFNTLGTVQIVSGWRYAVAISAIVSIICLVIYIITIKEKQQTRSIKLNLSPIKNNKIWLLGLMGIFQHGGRWVQHMGKNAFL